MSVTLSLSCSRKIYELLGDTYTTEHRWHKRGVSFSPVPYGWTIPDDAQTRTVELYDYPAPSFSETIRLLPKIAEKKKLNEHIFRSHVISIVGSFMLAPTEEEGMAKVSEYLESLI